MSVTIKFDFKKYFDYTMKILSKTNIVHILLISLVISVFVMGMAPDSKRFDEAAYMPASIATLHGIAANAEHPPLSKMLYAVSIGRLS